MIFHYRKVWFQCRSETNHIVNENISFPKRIVLFQRRQLVKKISEFFYYFLLPVTRESIVFGSNFRNGDFDGFSRL